MSRRSIFKSRGSSLGPSLDYDPPSGMWPIYYVAVTVLALGAIVIGSLILKRIRRKKTLDKVESVQ